MTEERVAVLHFASEPVRGGAEEHMLTLLRELDRTRYRPMLAAHLGLLELLRDDLPEEVASFPVELRGPRDLAGARRFMRVLREQRVALVHSHMFQASRLASPLAWASGVRAIIETPHIREHWRKGWLKGNFVLDRLVGRFVSKYIAVSSANAEYLLNEKRLPRDKVVVVRNGIAVEHFDPAHVAPPGMRDRIGLAHDAPVVLVLARLEPQKGHRVLLNAWPAVLEAFPRARLICIGEGALRDELEAQANSLGIAPAVTFAGYQANVADWLALADFTVLPSFFEGLPLAAIESLAAGRPVIASAVDGTSEVVIPEATGLLVPAGAAGPLTAAICRLLGSPELAQKLGHAGRKLVAREFSQSRQVAETEAVYETALGRRGRARAIAAAGKSFTSCETLSGGSAN
ncbi:MAG TPA: glycosyltransferase family 4 protein [Candidatus Binataceae bacterium]|nr:glycosyltransferase family 4 protein [Candidatus Binataceae bacterium]